MQTYPLWAVVEDRAGREQPRLSLVVGWEIDPDQPEHYAAVLVDAASTDGVAGVTDLGGDSHLVHLFANRADAERVRDRMVQSS